MNVPSRGLLLLGAVVLALVLGVWLLSSILLPFVVGMALAYLLDPVVDRCERWGIGRGVATSLVLAGAILAAALTALLLLPVVLDQAASFARTLPRLVERGSLLADELLRAVTRTTGWEPAVADLADLPAEVAARLGAWAAEAVGGVLDSAVALVNLLGLAVITPVVTWYLLRDWDAIVAHVDSLVPRGWSEAVRARAREVDEVLASFVRGQSLVCGALAAFYATALGLLGVPNGVFVGLFAGLVSFVPYVGTVIGLALAVGLAALAFGPAWQTAMAAVVFVVGQAGEEYVLRPHIIGRRVGLHPAWTVFALFAGGALFGFVGVLLAVPAAAAAAVLVRAGIAAYRAGPLYGGGA